MPAPTNHALPHHSSITWQNPASREHAGALGLDPDHDDVVAGLSLPYSNGPTEGINTKTKLIKRQMYGRAGFGLLRHLILLS